MIDLTQTLRASPLLHEVPSDPGTSWHKHDSPLIEPPPDGQLNPPPEMKWPARAPRTGLCGVVSPRVITLPGGGYRMYYTQILPRPGFPAGANDYDTSTTRILSAASANGLTWTPERGVRLTPAQGGAGDFRVVSSDVVPTYQGDGTLRMYYECCLGPGAMPSTIRSALSTDGGLTWAVEPGIRLGGSKTSFMSPRIFFHDDRLCRLYCCERGVGVISAVSEDGGVTFERETGVRISQDGPYDKVTAFASEVLRIAGGGLVMYYAGYAAANKAYILRAESTDGLAWRKDPRPVVSPGPGPWDAAKCSEVCLFRLPRQAGSPPTYGMAYEACDGTAKDQRGVWRIAGAVSSPR